MACSASMALAQGRWTWVSPLPQGNDLKKAVFTAGQYVAVGDLGTIVTRSTTSSIVIWRTSACGPPSGASPTAIGSSWRSARPAPFSPRQTAASGRRAPSPGSRRPRTWRSSVGVGGDGTIEASADGESWTAQDSQTQANLFAIAYGEGHTVVVGYGKDGAVVLTSTAGGVWQPRALQAICPSCRLLRAVTFGNGRFIACGDRGTILSSPDAVVWTLACSAI
jgi:hypothetical protein